MKITVATHALQADKRVGATCEAHQLQISLADSTALLAVRDRLAPEGAPGFHPTPGNRLHITVLPLIDPSNPLPALRAVLADRCRLPERPVRIPGITHATLARYRDPGSVHLDRRPDIPEVAIEIDRLQLIREKRYPSLDFDVLETFALSARP